MAQKDEAPRPDYKGQEKIQSGIHLTPKLFPTCHLTFSPLRKTFTKYELVYVLFPKHTRANVTKKRNEAGFMVGGTRVYYRHTENMKQM